MDRRAFLKSLAATAVVIAAPPSLAGVPAGRWVRGVQTLPGGWVGSVYFFENFDRPLTNTELDLLTSNDPPGGVPTIELNETTPVRFVWNGKMGGLVSNSGTILELWNPCFEQIEQGAFPTSYIPTEDTPVTRPGTSMIVAAKDVRKVMDFRTTPFSGGARHDYNQDGKWLGVLVEEQRTNFCLNSRRPRIGKQRRRG